MLTEENCLIAAAHPNIQGLYDSIHFIISHASLLTPENWSFVSTHADPHNFVQVLEYLKKADLFTDDNITLVSEHKYLGPLVQALIWIDFRSSANEVHPLTNDLLRLLVRRSDPLEVAKDLVP
jgi:hypothetical protein